MMLIGIRHRMVESIRLKVDEGSRTGVLIQLQPQINIWLKSVKRAWACVY